MLTMAARCTRTKRCGSSGPSLLAGLCPGTSCVAAASGRADGLALMVGLVGGILAFNLSFDSLNQVYASTPLGPLTLPDVLHLPAAAILGGGAAITGGLLGGAETTAVALAEAIVNGEMPRVFDLRPQGEFEAFHVPSATRTTLRDLMALDLPRTARVPSMSTALLMAAIRRRGC